MISDAKDFAESEIRRASLLSHQRFSDGNIEETEKGKDAPKDKYYLTAFVFFFLGFGGIVPMSFFLTATDYWMYKFRDINQDHYDAKNKTYLQANFASITSIVSSIPSLVTTILVSLFAHKINVRHRMMGTLSTLTATFIVFTIFVKVNTDSWQLGFFILTMAVNFVVTVSGILFGVTNFALMSKFPPTYLLIQMYGSTVGGIFSSVLQVICLAIGGSSTEVGLLYYLCGTSILIVTLCMAYITKYLPFYQYHMGDTIADTRRPLPSLADLKELLTRIWALLLPMVIGIPIMAWTSPTILILVVSEGYGNGVWNDKFFTPVITFLLPNVIGLIIKPFARPYMTRKNAKWFVLYSVVKMITFNPLFLFLNISPKHHLPVLFPHDWQYISLLCINAVLTDYVGTITFLSTPNLAGDKTEQAFLLIQAVAMILMSVSSPLNTVWVNQVI